MKNKKMEWKEMVDVSKNLYGISYNSNFSLEMLVATPGELQAEMDAFDMKEMSCNGAFYFFTKDDNTLKILGEVEGVDGGDADGQMFFYQDKDAAYKHYKKLEKKAHIGMEEWEEWDDDDKDESWGLNEDGNGTYLADGVYGTNLPWE